MELQIDELIEFKHEDGRVFSGPITRVKLQSYDAGNGEVYLKVWFAGQEPTDVGQEPTETEISQDGEA